MRINRHDIRLSLAIFCVLSCWYLLTNGNHIDSTDGETVFLVTESLVERGTFAQVEPEDFGDSGRTVVRGRDGHLYAVTGPLQSLLNIPLYVIGRLVALKFPSRFYPYFTRFFTVNCNSFVVAATVAVLYLFGVDIGYRRRTAAFTALTFGLATILWPYSHLHFAEPLHTASLAFASWSAYRYSKTKKWTWMAACGLSMGLGVASKYVVGVAGPILALYLLVANWHPNRHTRLRQISRAVLVGGLSFGLVMLALSFFNYARFGSLVETGYTHSEARGPMTNWQNTTGPLISWYSFFFSSGKGFFWFTPPALLALWGFPELLRRRRNLAILFIGLILVYPWFYSIVTSRWFGGANWGPRYIICVTPFFILPIGAFLERLDFARWLRVSAAVLLFTLGFGIQLSTVLVNYNQHLFSNTPFDHQLYMPGSSALLAQWRRWPQQWMRWCDYDHDVYTDGAPFFTLNGDVYPVEVAGMAPFGRWLGEEARLRLYVPPKTDLILELTYSRPRAAESGSDEWEGLQLTFDGSSVTSDRKTLTQTTEETQWIETITLPGHAVQSYPETLELSATTWTPHALGDSRDLGVFLTDITVHSNEGSISYRDARLPDPIPLNSDQNWSRAAMFWFYNPTNARPLDIWPWYIWTIGLPLEKARAFIGLYGGILISLFLVSTTFFVAAFRRASRTL